MGRGKGRKPALIKLLLFARHWAPHFTNTKPQEEWVTEADGVHTARVCLELDVNSSLWHDILCNRSVTSLSPQCHPPFSQVRDPPVRVQAQPCHSYLMSNLGSLQPPADSSLPFPHIHTGLWAWQSPLLHSASSDPELPSVSCPASFPSPPPSGSTIPQEL